MTSNTDDNGNAMFQSYLSKLFKKRNRLQIRSYRRYGEHGKKMFVFLGLYVHAAVRGGTCAFTLKIVNTLVKTAHATIGLRSRHKSNQRQTRFVSGKAGESRKRTRRYQVDPWSRGREVAPGVQRSSLKPEKGLFLPSERDREFLSPVFYTAAPKCVCIRRLAGARHLSPVVLWTL